MRLTFLLKKKSKQKKTLQKLSLRFVQKKNKQKKTLQKIFKSF